MTAPAPRSDDLPKAVLSKNDGKLRLALPDCPRYRLVAHVVSLTPSLTVLSGRVVAGPQFQAGVFRQEFPTQQKFLERTV